MALVLRYAIRSHVGLIREGNEDSGYAGPRLLAIADGMGGAAAGELASAVVMTTVSRLDSPGGEDPLSASGELPTMAPGGQPGPGGPGGGVPETEQTLHISQHDMAAREAGGPHSAPDPTLGEPDLALLGGAVVAANERLRAIVAERPELEGMGTTLTAMLWSGGRFGMVHVGDSRAYRLRDGLLEQMTADHTWVQRLIDEGRITEEEAGHHPQRSLLMRVLDGRTQVEADIGTFDAYPGDRYLLCSDGLSGFVSQETLAETLAAYPDPQQAVDALIELALRAGGPDNITCIVADTIDDGLIPGASPNESTQMLGSLTPVVVGAASEGVEQLPRFSTPAPGGQSGGSGPQDDFPQNHPAGRAARLRSRRGQQNQQLAAEHPGGPVATAPAQYDPSAQTTELESVPGQRGLIPEGDPAASRRHPGDGFGGPVGGPAGPGGPAPGKKSKKGLLITGAAVVVLAAAAGGAYEYSQGQYYVTPSSDNKQVLLYQGMSQLSFAASQESMSEGPLWIDSVPQSKRADLYKTESFGSKDAALAYLEQYRAAAKSCADYRHNQPVVQSQAQQQAQAASGKPAGTAIPQQNLAPSAPAPSSKAGAPLANGPGSTAPSSNAPTDIPTGTSVPGSGEQGSPAPQNPTSSPSAPQPGDDPQMKAYCAGTTDGP